MCSHILTYLYTYTSTLRILHMNQLTNPQFIKDLFRHYHMKPKDYLGQNFLVDEIALDKIVEAGDVQISDFVVEIGPGLGVLSQQLASRAGKVLAIEKDRTLIDILKFNMEGHSNFDLRNEDVLGFNFPKHVDRAYKVIANIPYYLTSHLFKYFLEQERKPERMVFLIQKEVGERVCAKPGEMSVLAVSVQLYADPEIIHHVPHSSFWPAPKVDSVVIRIIPKNKYPEVTDVKKFFRIVKVAFAAKRKQMHNNLANGLKLDDVAVKDWLEKNNIDLKARAQDLSMDDWVNLYKSYPEQ